MLCDHHIDTVNSIASKYFQFYSGIKTRTYHLFMDFLISMIKQARIQRRSNLLDLSVEYDYYIK